MLRSHIKQIMSQKGETVEDFVPKSLFSTRTISKARTDAGIAECRLPTLGRIANALEVPLKDLYDGEYEPPTSNGKGLEHGK